MSDALYHRGIRRADADEFLTSKFELQLRINGEWTTYSQPHALLAQSYWQTDIRCWRSLAIRMLRNGKVIRRRL